MSAHYLRSFAGSALCLAILSGQAKDLDFESARLHALKMSGIDDRIVVIKRDGTLWAACEMPGYGMVFGSRVFKSSPTQIDSSTNWAAVSTGRNSLVALKNDGTLWAWVGPTDHGTTAVEGVTTPMVKLTDDSNWSAVSGDGSHFVALRSNKTPWKWQPAFGWPPMGTRPQLSGFIPHKAYIVRQVGNDSDWVMVSSWLLFTVAIKTNATLWCWGTLIFDSEPRQLDKTANWAFVSCTEQKILAITRDGELWSWSVDSSRAGSSKNPVSPKVRIGRDSDWVAASAGEKHSVALKRNGSLWAWGDNHHGQLGNRTYLRSEMPVPMRAESDWLAGTACLYTLGLRKDFPIWVWGRVTTDGLPKTPPPPLDFFTLSAVYK